MRVGTKQGGKGGRPRKFDEDEVLLRLQRRLWSAGLSGVTLDGLARAAGINRPSLAASFGDKDAIYARAIAHYAAMMADRIGHALDADDLRRALGDAFDAAIEVYTADGPDGCFVFSTAPAEAATDPACRARLARIIDAIDAQFLARLAREEAGSGRDDLPALAGMLGATLQSIGLRARAGWRPDRLRAFAAPVTDLVAGALGGASGRASGGAATRPRAKRNKPTRDAPLTPPPRRAPASRSRS